MQGVFKTFGAYRICGDALFHQVVSYRSRSVFRQFLIHLVAAHVVRVAADFNVESGVSEQKAGDLCQLLAGSGFQRVVNMSDVSYPSSVPWGNPSVPYGGAALISLLKNLWSPRGLPSGSTEPTGEERRFLDVAALRQFERTPRRPTKSELRIGRSRSVYTLRQL